MGAPSDLSAGAECLNEVRSPQERRLLAGHLGGSYTQPQRSPLPTGAETGADGGVHEAPVDASTKSAPHRSGDSHHNAGQGPRTAHRLNEVRSPQERRPEQTAAYMKRPSTPQRSPLPTGAETEVVLHGPPLRRASTKSAPHRSGDSGLRLPLVSQSPPQRSPLPTGAETPHGGEYTVDALASTKSAPHRSGDGGPRPGRWRRPGLNEVRSPQERRLTCASSPDGC